MEIIMDLYMVIKEETKKYFLVKKIKKKFKKIAQINTDLNNLYHDNKEWFENDEKIIDKILKVDINKHSELNKLQVFLESYLEQNI
ncbi:hypothetical protein M4L39_02900 [Staphylococcus equorum]|uniref:Uncharacterized protein n=1 Tax=Staphylococcus equorum TaxID=246432 RepID=A0A9X4R2G9_9STAP|nr:hypothetical protein [Staphylococcus equorum]MDG0842374.1 hypothetical protein [Staphylococcus equorum]MDG0858493.1 hypothetical protein [Staphylococcus equorum]